MNQTFACLCEIILRDLWREGWVNNAVFNFTFALPASTLAQFVTSSRCKIRLHNMWNGIIVHACLLRHDVPLLSKANMFLTTHFYLLKIRGLIEFHTELKKLYIHILKLVRFQFLLKSIYQPWPFADAFLKTF